jgi:hypothetical protein
MLSKWRKAVKEEAGIATGTIILLVSGFAAVAIIATVWIGSTTAGLAADTAGCVVNAGGSSAPDPNCGTNSATGAGGGNAAAANNGRPLPAGFIDDFGSGSGKYDLSKLNQANSNLERGILRFSGLKLTIAQDTQSALNRLQNATTKANALAALQDLRTLIYTAQQDGETTTSESTIQVAANMLRELEHPAAEPAQAAQQNAANGNRQLTEAYRAISGGIDGYNTMTLAQLKGIAPTVSGQVNAAAALYAPAVQGLNETMAIVKANR